MNSIREIFFNEYPDLVKQIPSPPPKLYVRGTLPSSDHVFLTVVGTRKNTKYGKEACERLVAGLKGLPVVIVSGLAYGIDSIAHRAALDNGILTVAVPGSGLSDDVLYPAAHIGLAREILEKDGALVSPFDRDMAGTTWMFPHRNRIMAGMSHATLVIEANIKSGTLITSKHATEFNRNVCAVPGSIFSSVSEGPHMLIRLGATPIRHAGDLIEALGLDPQTPKATFDIADLSEDERRVVLALETPLSRDDLVEKLGMPVHEVSTLVSLLEIKGVIEELLGELRRI